MLSYLMVESLKYFRHLICDWFVIGDLLGGALKSYWKEEEDLFGNLIVLVGDTAAEHIEYHLGCCCTYPLSSAYQFYMCLYRCNEYLHVHFWSNQVLLTSSNGRREILPHPYWSSSNDSIQHNCGKRGRDMGSIWEQISFLRCQQRNQAANDSLACVLFRLNMSKY